MMLSRSELALDDLGYTRNGTYSYRDLEEAYAVGYHHGHVDAEEETKVDRLDTQE